MGKTVFISILILLVGFFLAYLGSKYISIIEFEISVVLAFMGIAYAFFQFQIEKIQAEKRRLNDIKLLVYNNLTAQANAILEDCSRFFIDHHPKASEESILNVSYICITMPVKINRLLADIINFNNFLNTNICEQYLINISDKMTTISKNLKNFQTDTEAAQIYEEFNGYIIEFAENLNNELLLRYKS